jgi:hypothetical protein
MSGKTPVEPMDPSKKNSPVTGPIEEESTVMLDGSQNSCYWNGQEYPEGTVLCAEGTVFECSFGKWVKQKEDC